MKTLHIKSPVAEAITKKLRTGDQVFISGVVYVGRDAAHKKIIDALDHGKSLPFELKGQTIYYMGPAPAKPGQPIGAAGPTTGGRMDTYSPRLLAEGLKVMIGKGTRSPAVKDAIKKYRGVYLAATGGAGALISKSIKKSEIVAYPELGAEAILRLEVEDFPAIVINDIYGGGLYREEQAKYRNTIR